VGRPHLTVLAGPTASGKTALAVRLARAWGAEIVSADSQQVYRHFDVGTAKPTAEELAAAPHHLVSVVEPAEPFSAARYQELADAAIAGAAARGRPVLVVGGTGLYIRVLLHGVMPAPPADPALRAELEAAAASQGREALHAELARVDPETAARLHPADLVRVVRALEVHRLTGTPLSALHRAHGFRGSRYPFRLYVLTPPREAQHAAIEARTRAMFEGGLLEEVRGLLARGYRDAPPMRSVGYAQALDVVEGRLTPEEGLRLAVHATRQYAKRQGTWFRKEAGAVPLAPPYDALDALPPPPQPQGDDAPG
jgi:tRNA dimethylallyltransferase